MFSQPLNPGGRPAQRLWMRAICTYFSQFAESLALLIGHFFSCGETEWCGCPCPGPCVRVNPFTSPCLQCCEQVKVSWGMDALNILEFNKNGHKRVIWSAFGSLLLSRTSDWPKIGIVTWLLTQSAAKTPCLKFLCKSERNILTGGAKWGLSDFSVGEAESTPWGLQFKSATAATGLIWSSFDRSNLRSSSAPLYWWPFGWFRPLALTLTWVFSLANLHKSWFIC